MSVLAASIFDVSNEAFPKLSGVVDIWQFARIVTIQGDEPALTLLPGLDEQFGLVRRYAAPDRFGDVVAHVYVPGIAVCWLALRRP